MPQAPSIRGPYITYDATATALNTGGIFRHRDIDSDIPFRRPYSAMFYNYLTVVPHGRTAVQDKVEFGEQEMLPNYVTLSADAGSGDTSLTVNNAYNVIPGDKLFNWRTGEAIRLSDVSGATTIDVAVTTGYGRGFGGTTAAAMRVGDRLYKMGTALTEHGRSPVAVNIMPEELYNYCSYYIKLVHVGRLQENSAMLGNFGKLDLQMMEKKWQQDQEVNLDLWKGKRALIVVTAAAAHDSGGGNLYQMDGFDAQVRTHSFDLSGVSSMTWEQWNEIISPVFDNDPADRNMFVGKNVNTSLTATARGNTVLSTYPSIIEGTQVTVIAVDGGTVHVIKDYDGLPPGSARIVHPGFVEYRERQGMDVQWIMNTQLPTQVMETTHTLLRGGTLLVKNEAVHAKIDNLGGPFDRGIRDS